jgi:hypothetical protein
MRVRISTAALSVLAVALWASGASAAAPLVLAPKFVVNLNLGGALPTSLTQDALSPRPTIGGASEGIQLDLARGRNWDAYADLFPASGSLTSAYLSGTTTSAAVTFALGHDVNLQVGHTALGLGALNGTQPSDFARDLASRLSPDLRNIGTTSASLNWNVTDWAALGISASHSTGTPLLNSGALRSAVPGDSTALGISARVGFGEGWVTTLAYSEGVTQLGLNREKPGDPLRSEGYGIGFAKQGLFGDDALGIALSRPLQIYTGNNGFSSFNPNFALANTQARESDLALGYVTTFLDGTLALQANAAYQLNAAGAKGQNAVAGVARAKLNF